MWRGDRGNHFSLRRGAILFAIIICCKGRKKHVLREIYSYTFYTKDKFMDKITLKYYNAQDFVQGTVAVDFYITQDRFLASWKRELASWILAAAVVGLGFKEPKM